MQSRRAESATAVAGTDYTAASGTLSWAAGDAASKTFTVSVLPVSGVGDKSVNLTLSSPTNADLGLPSDAVLSLVGTPKGDANGDRGLSIADVFWLINNLFAGGPAPIGPADVNADNKVDILDVFYLINYLFAGGAPPL